jgi:hypothetical protein
MPIEEQNCLIKNTIPYHMEENVINELLNQYLLKDKTIIVYGKNTNDDTVEKKNHPQLCRSVRRGGVLRRVQLRCIEAARR